MDGLIFLSTLRHVAILFESAISEGFNSTGKSGMNMDALTPTTTAMALIVLVGFYAVSCFFYLHRCGICLLMLIKSEI